MRHIEHVMGTVFSIYLPELDSPPPALTQILNWFYLVDATFSPFKVDSAVSQINAGALPLTQTSPLVADVLANLEALSTLTAGRFNAWAAGRLDPSGYVKGWSVELASNMLQAAGIKNHLINGGGDIKAKGGPRAGAAWRVALANPFGGPHTHVLQCHDTAVATSGTYERGLHVIDPATRQPVTELASVTVVGPDLGVADALATAALVFGDTAQTWLETVDGYEATGVAGNGSTWETTGFNARPTTGADAPQLSGRNPVPAAGERTYPA